MTAQPWLKFYPRDWRGDQALRAVSIAARGLWIECLCIMHEAKPYGHLVLNGNPVEDDTLARMTGVPVEAVRSLMDELRKAGVLSVTGKGVVFSRRMTKDHARAHKGRLSVKKRWQQASDGVEQSESPNRSPNRSPITQKPEARSQKEAVPNGTVGASPLPTKQAFEAYNATAQKLGLPTAKVLSADRQRKLAARLREHGISGWQKALDELAVAPWLLGTNDRGWRANLDFLLAPAKLNRLLEGGYRARNGTPNGKARPNGTGWIIPAGTAEYSEWRSYYAKENLPKMYDYPENPLPGYEAKAPCRWPSQLRRG